MKPQFLKLIVACALLPPLLYTATLWGLQQYLESRTRQQVESCYLGDIDRLLDGSLSVRSAISSNIDNWLAESWMPAWGIHPAIRVLTEDNRVVYPSFTNDDDDPQETPNPVETAATNFALLQRGMNVSVSLVIPHNTLFSNVVLAAYLLLTAGFLALVYRHAARMGRFEARRLQHERERLIQIELEHQDEIVNLQAGKQQLETALDDLIAQLETVKSQASRDEEALIEEIDTLEKRIKGNLHAQQRQSEEIQTLKQRLEDIESLRIDTRDKRQVGKTGKRFKALYRNLSVEERAVSGLLALPEEMRFKCEQVIHQLDDDPLKVTVKRKVFSGKNRSDSVFEVAFAGKGRLYFSRRYNQVSVLAIGTKNTQARELRYLANLD